MAIPLPSSSAAAILAELPYLLPPPTIVSPTSAMWVKWVQWGREVFLSEVTRSPFFSSHILVLQSWQLEFLELALLVLTHSSLSELHVANHCCLLGMLHLLLLYTMSLLWSIMTSMCSVDVAFLWSTPCQMRLQLRLHLVSSATIQAHTDTHTLGKFVLKHLKYHANVKCVQYKINTKGTFATIFAEQRVSYAFVQYYCQE